MQPRPQNEEDKLARQAVEEDSVFVQAVTKLADTREVVASEDIYARGGMKLIGRGTRLSGELYDRLVTHKLLKPIEHSLSISDALDARQLVSLMQDEARHLPSLAPLFAQPELLKQLGRDFSQLRIPGPLTVRLAVMQSDRPKLFQHVLISAVVGTALGISGKLPREELQALSLASVFHDVGELCIQPTFLEPGHQMTAQERRHLYVHPITGFLMLRDFADLPKETAHAVLQHHERIDGSGYPYHLSGNEISRVSRYLAVAEVAASLIEKHGADKRIGMKFRMNRKKYDANVVVLVSRLFRSFELQPSEKLDEAYLMTHLTQLGRLFEDWAALRKTITRTDLERVSALVDRVNALYMLVIEAGFDQCRIEDFLLLAGEADPEISMELTTLIDELNWQFRALLTDVERDPSLSGKQCPVALAAGIDGWLEQVRQFVDQ
ncbi:MAG TPA: HD domain-containing phosphohydrolase [Accumulibacter sp.]|uniref:HD-GYP domain-containing protein n=1 Tax=Accumulibacter sp. TaxID=2053492 RepID=UPI002CBC1BA7|nr:HD domain-containing phosphohydrolase [Accumulibacter sp.]HMW57405.1 HD domain-containing phosphohydrolase [Accumulibacter sp.]